MAAPGDPTDPVWYAPYGSNLSRARLSYYLRGGTLVTAADERPHTGARDRRLPPPPVPWRIDHPLVFASLGGGWSASGSAAVDSAQSIPDVTLVVLYQLTFEQFLDIWAQENGGKTRSPGPVSADNPPDGAYRELLELGTHEDRPILSFTAPLGVDEHRFQAPSDHYLSVIAAGIKSSFDLTEAEIVTYLAQRPGIEGQIDPQRLAEVVADAAEPRYAP